ncbi:hypothetical protein [Chryseobacterium sp. MP_3.2]|uniref:hypothetical protein n=1 Tax=Chryseobacterium sp. MP_3.2 TaxID=3071712 RepID=UPI002E15C69C
MKNVQVPVTPADALKIVNTETTLTQIIPAGSQIVLEVAYNGNSTFGFYLGTNTSAETKPSCIKSATCGLTTPVTTASIGFANSKWVMTITGENNLGVT